MRTQFDVIIVGGGPTGMMLACELALVKVKVLLLEKRVETVSQSRASTLHPRTLETFSARGILERFIERGEELLGKNPRLPIWHFASMFKLQLNKLDSQLNYTLWLPQTQTEKLLEEHAISLGAQILRGHEVINLIEEKEKVIVEIQSPSGLYAFQASYVVGCDGAGSNVRTLANIDFPGTNSTLTAVLADVIATQPVSADGKLSMRNEKGMVIGLPLDKYYTRFVTINPERASVDKREAVTLEEVKKSLQDICGSDFGIENPLWLSRFGNSNRLAANYKKGRILLAGDAAHMHFPTGGQGLNYGIQDAFNLGWKLAAQIKGWAPDWLLDSYHTERHAVGERLMYDVERQSAILCNFTEGGTALRRFFEHDLLEIPEVNALISKELAGFHIFYPPLSSEDHPLVGKRVPDLCLKSPLDGLKNLYSLLYDGRFVLVIFGMDKNKIKGKWKSQVRFAIAELAEERSDYQNLKAILVRPDAHVAWVSSQNCTNEEILFALKTWCGEV